MKIHAADLTLEYFTQERIGTLARILETFHQDGIDYNNHSAFLSPTPSDNIIQQLEAHRLEHGVTVGYLRDDDNNILGLAGFYFQEDVQLFETICYLFEDHADKRYSIINMLISEAFDNLFIDKICARALPGADENSMFQSAGYTYLGERAFTDEGRGQIWNYYELENDNGLPTVAIAPYSTSDWDHIF